jgi:hypothetical protein
MLDELSFEPAGFERIGGRLFDPRPAIAATLGGRSAADLDRETDEHYAKAEDLRRQAQECKEAAHVDKMAAIVAGLAAEPELSPVLVGMSEWERHNSDKHNQEADKEQQLGDQAKKQAEQARRDEEARRQQASPFTRRGSDGDVRRHDALKEGGVLPARGDLDRDHPGYRDTSGLA